MIFKKKFLLLIIFLVITIQTVLYTNNKQKTSFRYFIWTVKEISIGKLISISFFSGLLMSTLLNKSINTSKNNNLENVEDYYEPLENNEDVKSNVEMPPQRDIRDAQPTISVNYRVVKNTEENNLKKVQNFSNNNFGDDWDNNDDNDWE
tara:strand:- start:241 stop:687 length:447 start_codon:yes stop_codon:yes gene_type:complete